MKVQRYKRVSRYLSFYKNNFQFRSPYQVLIDGTFCQAALKYKVNIKEQLPKYLSDEVKMMTTVCVVHETERLGPALYGAMLVVKQFPVRKCGHEKKPIAASQCLVSMIRKNNNEDHYFLATQDPVIRREIGNVPGCPLMYMMYNAINLSKPTESSEKTAAASTERNKDIPEHEIVSIRSLKQEVFGTSEEKIKRKRKKKGPNPLSCKKKKKSNSNPTFVSKLESNKSQVTKSNRKRRPRIKLAKHVKKLLESHNIATE